MDAKTAITLLIDVVGVLGIEPELLEQSPKRVVLKPGHCPIYETGRTLGLDHSAIESLCRTRVLPRVERAAKELNLELRMQLIGFRAGKDDSCIEEISLPEYEPELSRSM